MNVLVTGGAGYIASHAVRLLVESGSSVVVLDDLRSGHRAAVGDVPLVVGNAGDEVLVSRVIEDHGVDTVMHFAASKSVEESVARPADYFVNNVGGGAALLRAVVRCGIRSFVYSSSCAVYGTPAELPVSEDAPIHPENPYGASKWLLEEMLPWLERSHGLNFTALRYFNAAGAWPDASLGEDWRDAVNLIPRVMKVAAGVEPFVTILGTDYPTPDGTAIRDYIHVLDLADAHLRAVRHLSDGGKSAVLNLGTGRGASVRDVITAVERASGKEVPVRFAPRRAGDPAAIWADPRRAEQLLGWRARRDLDEIAISAWRWHSTHPNGFRDRGQDG